MARYDIRLRYREFEVTLHNETLDAMKRDIRIIALHKAEGHDIDIVGITIYYPSIEDFSASPHGKDIK